MSNTIVSADNEMIVMFSIAMSYTVCSCAHSIWELLFLSLYLRPSWVYGLVAVIELAEWLFEVAVTLCTGKESSCSIEACHFWIYYLGSAGFWTYLCSDEGPSFRVKRKVFIAHAAVLTKVPCVLVTLTFIFFWPPGTVNHAVKIAHQHCVAVEKHWQ